MGFLAPWFLAGIAAISLPVWLHLLRRYKSTPQPFSSLMFFERRVQSSVKHRRLRHLALLSARIALLLLLALAFANPFVRRATSSLSRKKLTVIAIDRSFSMRFGDHMQRAKTEARRLVDAPGGGTAQVIAVDAHVENLTGPELDRSVLRAAIESVQANDSASSFGELARALRMMDQSSGMALSVHFISDMQQASMPASFRDLQLGPHTALTLHRIGQDHAANWAVDAVNTAARVYDAKNTRLTATLVGFGTPAAQRRVSLVMDGRVISSKLADIPPNGRTQVEFVGFDVRYGAHRGEVRMEPQDQLPNDDSFRFSVERSDPRPLLFLSTGGHAHEDLYYRTALESAGDIGLTLRTELVGQAAHDDLSKDVFIVLNDTADLNADAAQALETYVTHGGAVLIAVGPNIMREGRTPLSNDAVSASRGIEGAGFADMQHPALAGTGHFENVQFFDHARLVPNVQGRTLARFADGSPLLVEEAMGEGRILIFASTLDNSTSDFPLHSSFVPFVVQTARYLSKTEEAPASVSAGTPVLLRRSRAAGAAADVVGPDGKHLLSLSEATTVRSFDLTQDGFYEVQGADGRRTLVAVDADRRESDLQPVSQETLDLWRNTGNTAAEGRPTNSEQQVRPWSFWRYVMVLALVAALVESMFEVRYLGQERQAA